AEREPGHTLDGPTVERDDAISVSARLCRGDGADDRPPSRLGPLYLPFHLLYGAGLHVVAQRRAGYPVSRDHRRDHADRDAAPAARSQPPQVASDDHCQALPRFRRLLLAADALG